VAEGMVWVMLDPPDGPIELLRMLLLAGGAGWEATGQAGGVT
jgi:hypothetical protein